MQVVNGLRLERDLLHGDLSRVRCDEGALVVLVRTERADIGSARQPVHEKVKEELWVAPSGVTRSPNPSGMGVRSFRDQVSESGVSSSTPLPLRTRRAASRSTPAAQSVSITSTWYVMGAPGLYPGLGGKKQPPGLREQRGAASEI